MTPRIRSHARAGAVGRGVALLVVLVLVVAGGAAWEIVQNRSGLRERALERSLLQARLQAGVIAASVAGRLKLVEGFARRPSLIRAIEQERWPQTAAHLDDLVQIEGGFTGAAILDRRGIVRSSRPADTSGVGEDRSFRDYFTEALDRKEAYLSESFVQEKNPERPVIAFSAAVRSSSGEVVAVLRTTSELSFAAFSPFLEREKADVKVFDRTGRQLLGAAVRDGRTDARRLAVRAALTGRSGMAEFHDPAADAGTLAAYAPVAEAGWGVVVEEPIEQAYAGSGSLISRQLLGALVVLAAAALAAFHLARLLRQLTGERKRSHAILQAIPDGVVLTDPAGGILLANPAMEKLLGRSSEQMRGRFLQEVNGFFAGSEAETETVVKDFYSACRRGEAISSTGDRYSIRSGDGRTIPISWTAAPILDDQGELTSIVTVVRDVSREREADQLKAGLVSTVSHELRTPLTMIRGFAELLMTRELPEGRRQVAVSQIFEASERLSLVIDDLLAVSRIESGRLVLDVGPVDVATAVAASLTGLPETDRKRVSVGIEDDLPSLLGDEDQVVQVLNHLISNALKFSKDDSRIDVEARWAAPVVELAVRDRGAGLSPKDRDQVFDKFFRADNRDTREKPGTGLGLYITKNLVEMQGGQIRLHSEEGRGTTVYVCFPPAPAGASLSASAPLSLRGVMSHPGD